VLVFLLFVRGQRMPANPLVLFIATGIAGFSSTRCVRQPDPYTFSARSFPNYPPPSLPLESMRLARNAIPSLHSAWALLIWWSTRYCRAWTRLVATVFLALTPLATLGLGEHYLIDLVVALPSPSPPCRHAPGNIEERLWQARWCSRG
jgi:PAP2 superfamily